jgi:DNA-directed RNA polymerase subunit omega
MIDSLRNADLANKVGGVYKLTVLIQKRLVELIQGSRPLIENVEGKTNLEIVIEEILQDKITLDMTESAKTDKIGDEHLSR